MSCEVIKNTALGKEFFYCRDHKVECSQKGCIANHIAPIVEALENRQGITAGAALESLNTLNRPTLGKVQLSNPTNALVWTPVPGSGSKDGKTPVTFRVYPSTTYTWDQDLECFSCVAGFQTVRKHTNWFVAVISGDFTGIPADKTTWAIK